MLSGIQKDSIVTSDIVTVEIKTTTYVKKKLSRFEKKNGTLAGSLDTKELRHSGTQAQQRDSLGIGRPLGDRGSQGLN